MTTENDTKLKELILYLVDRSATDDRFGAIKLNKLLFYADFLAYVYLGKSITGQDYQVLDKGPAPRRLVPVREEMKASEEIAIRVADFGGYKQNRVVPLRDAKIDLFSAEEIALVDEIVGNLWGRNGKNLSDMSHKFAGWKLAKIGDEIPYSVALVGEREPTPDEIEYGKTLEKMAQEF